MRTVLPTLRPAARTSSWAATEMPTKRERMVRLAEQAVLFFVALKLIRWSSGEGDAVFGIVTAVVLGAWRGVMNKIDPELIGYQRHDVNGADRWFCEVCGKEEGECARCYEVEI